MCRYTQDHICLLWLVYLTQHSAIFIISTLCHFAFMLPHTLYLTSISFRILPVLVPPPCSGRKSPSSKLTLLDLQEQQQTQQSFQQPKLWAPTPLMTSSKYFSS